MDEKPALFEGNRRLLEGLAYRMLGTLADAQDVVQETYLKWRDADLAAIENARAWLVTVCSRLSLNVLNSARAHRESYVGPWLPEPYLDDRAVDPAERARVDDSVSVALMLALENLSPAERAAFLLNEIFDFSFDEIAAILGKNSAACRKLASRARIALKAEKPRFTATSDEHQRLVGAFLQAARSGDLDTLKSLLADSVELHSDGGGKVTAVPEILRGLETVGRFFAKIGPANWSAETVRMVPHWFNGVPGVLIYDNGRINTALTASIADGRITGLYALRNPDKLAPFPSALP
jgi:RNA polymerase sigma-70 factor (ECF subfamily)